MRKTIILVIALFCTSKAHSSYDIDIKELDAAKTRKPTSVKPASRKLQKSNETVKMTSTGKSGFVPYTVRQGDHIFKILIERFGYSNIEAEKLIPTVLAENGISDIRRLKVGMKLFIPSRSNHSSAIQKLETRKAEKVNKPPVKVNISENVEISKKSHMDSERALDTKPENIEKTPPAPAISNPLPKETAVGNLIAVQIESPDQGVIFTSVAEAVSLLVEQGRIVTWNNQTSGSFSIKVPLYAEGKGKKIIVAPSSSDPFQYTIYRILESDGYSVIRFAESDRFREVAGKLLKAAGIPSEYRKYRLEGEGTRDAQGYVIKSEAGRLLLTEAPVSGIWSAFAQ